MDYIIGVKKLNEVYLKLSCSLSIAEELSQYFTFYAPDYEFSPLYRSKKWDGKIRLFKKKNNLLYYGLLIKLTSFAKERGYKLDIEKEVLRFNFDFDQKEALEYIETLNLHAHGKPITVKDYQLDSFVESIKNKRCIIKSPTASGKSLVIYLISKYLLELDCSKGLIIVPTISLVEQLYSDFGDYSFKNKWDVDSNCQKITAEYSKTIEKRLTISTWQSIHNLPKEFFEQFDFVIGDEAHTFQAKSLSNIMISLTNAKYRIGTTGTIKDSKVHKLTLESHFGTVYNAISTNELMKRKDISQLNIKCVVLKYSQKDSETLNSLKKEAKKIKINKTASYDAELEFITQHTTRNNFIVNLASSLEGNTLVLYRLVEKHGMVLKELFDSNNTKKRKIFFVYGGTDAESREQIRSIVEKEMDAIIIASYGTFSTGVSIRNLHNVIFASPSKSKIKVLQSIGRSLRMSDTKNSAVLYDIADDLRLENSDYNYGLLHFMERMKIYHEEKFKVKTITVDMRDYENRK
jgi:superfamily II DNA or RNA helicase